MKKALVVDDTKNIRIMLTTCLELSGFNVTTANNGSNALESVKKESFDIAFIDIKMPEMSGTELLRNIRSLGLDFPVVIMTAFATVKNAVECTKLGAVAYLQKPFSQEKVNDTLKLLENFNITEKNAETKMSHAYNLVENSSFEEAYSYLKKILSSDPACGETYYLIGLLHKKNGNDNEADKFFKTAELFGYSSI